MLISVLNMNYKKIPIDYELEDILRFYLEHISSNIFSLENFLDIEKFNHRGSVTLGNKFFTKFPILTSNLISLFGKDNYIGRFFVTKPNSKGFIHTDMAFGELKPRHWSLNLPIANCKDTYHEFYATKSNPDLISTKFNSWFWTTDNASTLLDSVELLDPHMFNVAVPHRINNPTDQPRVVLAIRTLKNEETFDFL